MSQEEFSQKSFLKRIQSADEGTKRRWLIWGTAIVMAVIFFVWVSYFNGFLAPSSVSARAEDGTGEGGFSFTSSVAGGLALAYEGVKNVVTNLAGLVGRSKSYEIYPAR